MGRDEDGVAAASEVQRPGYDSAGDRRRGDDGLVPEVAAEFHQSGDGDQQLLQRRRRLRVVRAMRIRDRSGADGQARVVRLSGHEVVEPSDETSVGGPSQQRVERATDREHGDVAALVGHRGTGRRPVGTEDDAGRADRDDREDRRGQPCDGATCGPVGLSRAHGRRAIGGSARGGRAR